MTNDLIKKDEQEWWRDRNAPIPDTLRNIVTFGDVSCLVCGEAHARILAGQIGEREVVAEVRCPDCLAAFTLREPAKAIDHSLLGSLRNKVLQKWKWQIYEDGKQEKLPFNQWLQKQKQIPFKDPE